MSLSFTVHYYPTLQYLTHTHAQNKHIPITGKHVCTSTRSSHDGYAVVCWLFKTKSPNSTKPASDAHDPLFLLVPPHGFLFHTCCCSFLCLMYVTKTWKCYIPEFTKPQQWLTRYKSMTVVWKLIWYFVQ